jgi:flagellar biosynthetic protein FlhB
MPNQSDSEEDKSFEPTAHRLAQAYEKGEIPFSQDLSQWFGLAAIALLMLYLLPSLSRSLGKSLHSVLQSIELNGWTPIASVARSIVWQMLLVLAIPLSLLLLVPVIIGLLQTSRGISGKNLHLKWDKVSPIAGFKRLFSQQAAVGLLKNILKMLLLGCGAWSVLSKESYHWDAWIFLSPAQLLSLFQSLASKLFVMILAIYGIMTLFDVWYQRFSFMKRMRMSHQELKEEMKELEGHPHIRRRLKQIREQKARQQIQSAVKQASVVIMNPTHFAVALRWDEASMHAPLVIAKGRDHRAFLIRDLAIRFHIPVVTNPFVARSIYDSVSENQEIKPEHYQAVARIIQTIQKLP